MSTVSASPARATSIALAALCGLALMIWGVMGSPLSASASTITVTSTSDSGAGSLRAAIADAVSGDVINFALPDHSTISLESVIPISAGISIDGPGSSVLTITRANANNFDLFDFGPTSINQDLTVSGLTIDGTGGGAGTAISVGPGTQTPRNVTVSDVTVEHQTAPYAPAIGVNDILGTLAISNSSFIENTATNYGGAVQLDSVAGSTTFTSDYFQLNTGTIGGAVYVDEANALTFDNSEFDGNAATTGQGGGLFAANVGGAISIQDSSGFRGNAAKTDGGAIYVDADPGGFSLSDSLVSGNTDGVRDIGSSTYINGNGAGIDINSVTGSTTVSGTTITGNVAIEGEGAGLHIGSISGAGFLSVSKSTFSSNSEFFGGGGIDVETASTSHPFAVDVDSSTFSGNVSNKHGSSGASILVQDFTSEVIVTNSTLDEESDFQGNLGALALGPFEAQHPGDTLALLESDTLDGPGGMAVFDLSNEAKVKVYNTILQSANSTDPALFTYSLPADTVQLTSDLLSTAKPSSVQALAGTHFSVTDLQLGALADNGGPTLTRLPALTSPARNAGDTSMLPPGGFDQRGAGFKRVVQQIDIGAVEIQTPEPLATTGGTIDWRVPVGGSIALVLGLVLFTLSRRRTAVRR